MLEKLNEFGIDKLKISYLYNLFDKYDSILVIYNFIKVIKLLKLRRLKGSN